jgi:hypothetical protein
MIQEQLQASHLKQKRTRTVAELRATSMILARRRYYKCYDAAPAERLLTVKKDPSAGFPSLQMAPSVWRTWNVLDRFRFNSTQAGETVLEKGLQGIQAIIPNLKTG